MMVWARISYGYRTQLVVIDGNLNAQKYRDRVVAQHVVPLLQNHGIIFVFQQDNARPHITRDNIQFLLFLSYKITALFLCFSKTTPDLTSPVTISSSCETTILIS